MTEDELLDLESDTEEYADLLSQANYNREKFNLLLRSMLKPGVSLIECLQSLNLVFDLDNAVGDQLDIIGNIVGASRLLNYVPASGDRVMDDNEFRIVIKLTIAQNAWDGTLGSLKEIYEQTLGEGVKIKFTDNQDMTVTINVSGDLTTREVEILRDAGLFLVPVGVGKTVTTTGGAVTFTAVTGVVVSGISHTESVVATLGGN